MYFVALIFFKFNHLEYQFLSKKVIVISILLFVSPFLALPFCFAFPVNFMCKTNVQICYTKTIICNYKTPSAIVASIQLPIILCHRDQLYSVHIIFFSSICSRYTCISVLRIISYDSSPHLFYCAQLHNASIKLVTNLL